MPNHAPLPLVPISQLTIERYCISAHLGCLNTSIHPDRPLTIYRRPFVSTTTNTTISTPFSSSSSSYSLPTPASIESHLMHHSLVHPSWRYTMYPQDHFHSNTNEVLVVISPKHPNRSGLIRFGGPEDDTSENTRARRSKDDEDEGEVVVVPLYIKVRLGDVIIIPAGVSHAFVSLINDPDPVDPSPHPPPSKQPDDRATAFKLIGAYPPSSESWDMCYPTSRSTTSEDEEKVDDPVVRYRQRVEKVGWFERDPIYGLKGLI